MEAGSDLVMQVHHGSDLVVQRIVPYYGTRLPCCAGNHLSDRNSLRISDAASLAAAQDCHWILGAHGSYTCELWFAYPLPNLV